MSVKVQTAKPILVLLYGFPGAGKTYFSQNLAEHLACAHVHGDRIRHELFEEPRYDRQENDVITQLMQYMTEEFLSAGISVIYDANTIRKSQRMTLREMARKRGAKTVVVWFQMDPDTAFERMQKRDRRKTPDKYAMKYSKEMFKKFISHMQHPDLEDYVVVSGKHTFPSQQTAFFKKLVELGYIKQQSTQNKVVMPGLVNLIPRINVSQGRVDLSRRNINIR